MERNNNKPVILLLVIAIVLIIMLSIYIIFFSQTTVRKLIQDNKKAAKEIEQPTRSIFWDKTYINMTAADAGVIYPGMIPGSGSPYSFTDHIMLKSPSAEGLTYYKLPEKFTIADTEFTVELIFKNEILFQVKLQAVLDEKAHYEKAWLVYQLLEAKYGLPQNNRPLKQSDFIPASYRSSMLDYLWNSELKQIRFYTLLDQTGGINLMYTVDENKLWIESEANQI